MSYTMNDISTVCVFFLNIVVLEFRIMWKRHWIIGTFFVELGCVVMCLSSEDLTHFEGRFVTTVKLDSQLNSKNR